MQIIKKPEGLSDDVGEGESGKKIVEMQAVRAVGRTVPKSGEKGGGPGKFIVEVALIVFIVFLLFLSC